MSSKNVEADPGERPAEFDEVSNPIKTRDFTVVSWFVHAPLSNLQQMLQTMAN